jgi:hypothetical protein
LLAINKDIFNDESNRDPKYALSPNLYDNFVDFTKLPPADTLSKEVKQILYRPDKMKVLRECYDRLCSELVSNHHRDELKTKDFVGEQKKRLHWEARFPRKPEEEFLWISRIANKVATYKSDVVVDESMMTDPRVDINTDPAEFDKTWLQRLIDEHRSAAPYHVRKQNKVDTTDAVDTTELEGWFLRVGDSKFNTTREELGLNTEHSDLSPATETDGQGLTDKGSKSSVDSVTSSGTEKSAKESEEMLVG